MLQHNTSKNKINCIGPCYKPGTIINHPISFIKISEEYPFCPIEPKKTVENNNLVIKYTDECTKPTDDKDINVEINVLKQILTPVSTFNCKTFLKQFYNLYSFENTIFWFKKNLDLSIYSLLRILNCAWTCYGKNTDITNDTVEVYDSIIKKYWIKLIYNTFYNNITVSNNKIFISKEKNNDDITKNKIEKINYIMTNFLEYNQLRLILDNYVEINSKNWENILDHNQLILNNLMIYIENNIENFKI